MLFSSFAFLLLFLPIVVSGNFLLHTRVGALASQWWLLGASLFFYGFARPAYLTILAASIVFNWSVSKLLVGSSTSARRRIILWLGLSANIALLCSFKYVKFFLGRWISVPDWAFPLGISFFTLTQVMYLVDCYQELSEPLKLRDYAGVVSFFPYVSSGPIVSVQAVARQFAAPNLALAAKGLYIFAFGLAKKVVLADSFATIANAGFGITRQLSTLEAWAFSLAFTMQLYFDFSGYSDMAVGVAWMLGIEIPQNFNQPYRSQSISEFWQRWHISLSSFITSYLYTPILRLFKRATLRTSAVATLLAMTIAGLWHGPGWTYIVFGVMHGVALVLNQYWRKTRRRLFGGLGWLLTFLWVDLSFVVFRSRDLGDAMRMFGGMFSVNHFLGAATLAMVFPMTALSVVRPVTIGLVLVFCCRSAAQRAESFSATPRAAMSTALLLVVSMLYLNSTVARSFVYFAF